VSLRIYGTSRSRTFRVLWAAKELGLEFDHIPLSWESCRNDAAYRSVNPQGTIPAISDEGFVLTESLAINLYLAQKAQRLWPDVASDQALALQWSLWAISSVEDAYTRWASHTHFLPESLRDVDVAEAAADALRRPLEHLNAHLANSDWMLGRHFSIADLNVASVIPLLHRFEADKRPHLSDWLNRCRARPAYHGAAALP